MSDQINNQSDYEHKVAINDLDVSAYSNNRLDSTQTIQLKHSMAALINTTIVLEPYQYLSARQTASHQIRSALLRSIHISNLNEKENI